MHGMQGMEEKTQPMKRSGGENTSAENKKDSAERYGLTSHNEAGNEAFNFVQPEKDFSLKI